jgi:hypothetical protein
MSSDRPAINPSIGISPDLYRLFQGSNKTIAFGIQSIMRLNI